MQGPSSRPPDDAGNPRTHQGSSVHFHAGNEARLDDVQIAGRDIEIVNGTGGRVLGAPRAVLMVAAILIVLAVLGLLAAAG